MLRLILLSGLLSSAYALPHRRSSPASRDEQENAPAERGLFWDDQQQCTGVSLLTQELASGGLFGGARDQRVNYINSHNDEVQSVPFHNALNLSIASIEIDLWLYDTDSGFNTSAYAPEDIPTGPTLVIGHDKEDLDLRRTFKKLYLDPIIEIVERVGNPKPQGPGWNGVFTDVGAPGETLILMVEPKEKTPAIWEALVRELQPLYDANYLTQFVRNQDVASVTDGQLIRGPVTVIGTGYTPTTQVVPMNPRFIFKDGPLMAIDQPMNMTNSVWNGNEQDTTPIEWHWSISPTASDNIGLAFTEGASDTIKDGLKAAASAAQAKQIQTRWWGLGQSTAWGAAYDLQKGLGGDWLHADDLAEAVGFEKDRLEALSEECISTESS